MGTFKECFTDQPNKLIEIRKITRGKLVFVYIWFNLNFAWISPTHNMDHQHGESFAISNPEFFEKLENKCDELLNEYMPS